MGVFHIKDQVRDCQIGKKEQGEYTMQMCNETAGQRPGSSRFIDQRSQVTARQALQAGNQGDTSESGGQRHWLRADMPASR